MALLEVKNLSVTFDTRKGALRAVDGVSLAVNQGETLGIVGESGSGKSVTSLALMGLLPPQARMEYGTFEFEGKDLSTIPTRKRCLSMIFQDPMTSLNPCFTVRYQLEEALWVHCDMKRGKERKSKAIELLERVGINEAELRLKSYPHELSGGMAQRVMIAMAIACRPRLLIADEPTTALDVTIQAQILQLLKDLQKQNGMALILITHDLGVVAQRSDRLLVMYAGQGVESGTTMGVLKAPSHPYTQALLECLPSRFRGTSRRLPTISGVVPDLIHRPEGCLLSSRCKYADDTCRNTEPISVQVGPANEFRWAKCLRPLVDNWGEAHGLA